MIALYVLMTILFYWPCYVLETCVDLLEAEQSRTEDPARYRRAIHGELLPEEEWRLRAVAALLAVLWPVTTVIAAAAAIYAWFDDGEDEGTA